MANLEQHIQLFDSPYDYRWNYPVARSIANNLFEKWSVGSKEKLWNLLLGEESLQYYVEELYDLKNGVRLFNYLPPIPKSNTEQPATLDAYRSLGAMVLLDIDFWEGQSEKSLNDCYHTLLKNMQAQTAFIALGESQKPIGYIAWDKNSDGIPVRITRQSAPFGDHIELLKSWQIHLSSVPSNITSLHLRSARQEQAAW